MKKQLSVSELLAPRYLVIADYPHSPYKIGDLVEISDSSTSFHCTTTKAYDSFREDIVDSHNYFSIQQVENYKHLFRPLAWHELRSVEEMPEYLKAINQDFICKPIYHPGDVGLFYINEDEADQLLTMEFLPSNKTEYEQYLQTKTKAK